MASGGVMGARTHRLADRVAARGLVGLVALLFGGCGGGGATAADGLVVDAAALLVDAAVPSGADLAADPGGLSDLAMAAPDLVEPYPAGPYGTEVGEVPRNFTWQGYLDLDGVWPADRLPLTQLSFQDLRLAGGRYLFLATGAFW